MRVRAGEIDWPSRYRDMVAASDAAAPPRPPDRWQGRAARFDRMSRKALGDAEIEAGLAPIVRPSDVVIDVGAGTGRHAIPLATRCARLVAIEPSPAMRALLSARVAEERASNVEVIGREWPDDEAPLGDVVFSAHVVYGVAEIVPFVSAMTERARRTCALLLKLSAPADALADVAQALHGVRRPRRPGALEALAVLHQLGHAAELAILRGSSRPMSFSDDEDDLREVAMRTGVSPDAEGLGRVRLALDQAATRTSDGWLVGEVGPTARVTWPGRG